MLRFRPIVNTVLVVLLLMAVGAVFWLRRPAQPGYLDTVDLTPPPMPDDLFVGDEMVPPVPLAEFDLINFSGERVSNADLQGKTTLLSFAYTSCPDTCPAMFGRFLGVQEEFGAAIGADVELVFVTVDPEVDTPERLQRHAEAIDGKWYFLTEELAAMQKVWEDFRVYVEKEGALVGHSNVTYLIDDLGLIRVRYSGLPPTSIFVADLQKLLDE